MTNLAIAQQRLHNQLISQQMFEKPGDVVQWLGAVQSQDYGAAKWAVGLRLQGATDVDIEQALTDGAILRTHVMRPTWHFVAPGDIRWLLALTAQRVHKANAYYYHAQGLDDAIFMRSHDALAKALQGGKQFTREELVSVLKQADIVTENMGYMLIIMHAELDGIICSGARRGKQFTYALLDERVPATRVLEHDEALAEFALRYFTSHGPATIQDFVWWSGLTVADARAALAMVTPQLLHEVVEGQAYWFAETTSATSVGPSVKDIAQMACLLPDFDEYTVGYKDRSAVFDASHTEKFDLRGNVLNNILVLDGQVIGTWRRTLKKDEVIISPSFFVPLSTAATCAFVAEANRYGTFLEKSVHATWTVV